MSNNTNVPTDDDGVEDVFPRAEVIVTALTFFTLMLCGICSLIYCYALLREKEALVEEEADVEAQESEEEKIRIRKEYISNGLKAKVWGTDDDKPVKSAGGDEEDTPPSGETETVEVPQPPAPPTDSSPVSCAIGSDDCDSAAGADDDSHAVAGDDDSHAVAGDDDSASVSGDEESEGCAICLSKFTSQQLVCESNNSSCLHMFHKDCMMDWLVKHSDNTCPMCREVYLTKCV
jgi:hypothetical protein